MRHSHKPRKAEGHQKLEETRKGPLLEPSEGAWPCWHLGWQGIHFWCSKPPGLWYFATVAIGNNHRHTRLHIHKHPQHTQKHTQVIHTGAHTRMWHTQCDPSPNLIQRSLPAWTQALATGAAVGEGGSQDGLSVWDQEPRPVHPAWSWNWGCRLPSLSSSSLRPFLS